MDTGDDWTTIYRTMIEDCRKRDRYLSAWEADFLDSIEERLDGKRQLTEKQMARMDEIWEKCTAKG